MNVLMLSGSRNPEGQTARAVDALLRGVEAAGGEAERVFLPELSLERCRQCDAEGWGMCRSEGRCVIEDDLAMLVEKVQAADAVVFATPVYYSDVSESLRAFTDRLRRLCTHHREQLGLQGKRAVGVCVAGGGGGGAPACCTSLTKVLATCGFDVVDMLPVRRQNLEAKLENLERTGRWLVDVPGAG